MTAPWSCSYCDAGVPSVWDSVLGHWAHQVPGEAMWRFCHEPWAERRPALDNAQGVIRVIASSNDPGPTKPSATE